MFRVRLDNEDMILSCVSGEIRRRFIQILPKDRVKIEVSRYDSTSGHTVIASSPGKEVHDPWAFYLHIACSIRFSPIAENSPLLPPVGVWVVSQFQSSSPTTTSSTHHRINHPSPSSTHQRVNYAPPVTQKPTKNAILP
ncbi:hypothetical protein RJ640_000056 [Escallonia rubra]|uniref:S1-like domain-containing protein n=1 Tax=Escallonia rubra TaxID=112253 RepID=A0AA88URJ4_9ASTE|nr:hypothetical protein RJ640_000056 [Escallonia rubra]